jgi:teichuronic acid biosynthesis glycosyltransferase TuaH
VWDDVWRRNQFLTDALLRSNEGRRILFVEPAVDPISDLGRRRRPALPRIVSPPDEPRLRLFRPLRPLPRRLAGVSDRIVFAQVRHAVRLLGFHRPTLWVNDLTYATLLATASWPSLYDITDDWLLAPFPHRELDRLAALEDVALASADEVVVCSAALARSRGARREVRLVPNGVDVARFRRPQPRPRDLPAAPVGVYVGSLHDARLDVELVGEVADALPRLQLVFVGPDSLEPLSRAALAARPNVTLLGRRPYETVPAYLQHADVLVVPHRVSAFTDSLDPIKAYECLAVDTPTVATPVAGFRELESALHVVERACFAERVRAVLDGTAPPREHVEPVDWSVRAEEFEAALERAAARRA